NFVAVGIDHFLVGARVNARQAENTLHKLPVGPGVIFRPAAIAEHAEVAESPVTCHADRIAEAGKSEFVFLFLVAGIAITSVSAATIVTLLQRQQRGTGTEEQREEQTARQQLRHGKSFCRVSDSGSFLQLSCN